MINLSFLKRLIAEDFEKKDQDLIGRIGGILNPALDGITTALSKGLGLNDINGQTKELAVQVNSSGVPSTECSFKSELKGKASILLIGKVINMSSNNTMLTGAPFATFSQSDTLITITHITGLTPGVKYKITIFTAV